MTASLFGMVVNQPAAPGHFPSVPFSWLRLWDTVATWADIHTFPQVFNWKALDAQLAAAAAAGKDVLYTIGNIPPWNKNSVADNVPLDLATGNLAFKTFVANLVLHSLNSSKKIAAYEIWNEPDLRQYWTGLPQGLMTLARDAYAIIKALDPDAIVVGPAGSGGYGVKDFITQYYGCAQPGAAPQDVFAYHAYLGDGLRIPSHLPVLLNSIANTKATFGLSKQPTWFTEGGWGVAGSYSPPLTSDEQVAYLAQMYLQMWLAGVECFNWYAWDNAAPAGAWGTLWTASGINPAGVAYGVLSAWLTGSAVTSPATQNANGTWTAPLALVSGASAQIVWNPTAMHSLSTKALTYSTLDGKDYPVKNGSVTVSAKPILLLFV